MSAEPKAPEPGESALEPRAMLERAAAGIARIGSDGCFADANPRMQQIAGRGALELARLRWADIAHPDDGSQGAGLLHEVAQGERSEAHFEHRVLRPDASWVWVSVSAAPMCEKQRGGELVLIVRDVTTARLHGEALRRSEQRFRRLIEKLPACAYTVDREGLISYYNDRAVRMWGRAPKLYHPDDRWCGSFKLFAADGSPLAHEHCYMARALREGREYHGQEAIIERPDGSRAFVLAHASPLRDESGGVIGALNVLVDITDRKRAERELVGSERRFAQFMEQLPGYAWIKDAEGRYVYVNTAIEKERGAMVGKTDAEIFGAAKSEAFTENDRRVLLAGAAFETVESAELEDGVQHWLVNKFPIPGPDGSPAHVGGVAFDVTEGVRNREALLRADRRKNELLAALADSLRGRLPQLREAQQRLRESASSPELLSVLDQEVARLESLVDALSTRPAEAQS